ncbi:MAG: hypothetical protein HY699_11465 [Deltaproteobacteria bacterium]|nr:hypothetical protein [Deltaproteobacteria bacterium]
MTGTSWQTWPNAEHQRRARRRVNKASNWWRDRCMLMLGERMRIRSTKDCQEEKSGDKDAEEEEEVCSLRAVLTDVEKRDIGAEGGSDAARQCAAPKPKRQDEEDDRRTCEVESRLNVMGATLPKKPNASEIKPHSPRNDRDHEVGRFEQKLDCVRLGLDEHRCTSS